MNPSLSKKIAGRRRTLRNMEIAINGKGLVLVQKRNAYTLLTE